MKILVTGACGYVGTLLTQALINNNHHVIALDTQWFGNKLEDNPRLQVFKLDIREVDSLPLEGVEAIIHLANIANDPSVDLNPTLSWEVNVLASQQLIEKAIDHGVKHIIYASSGSVYGVKEEEKVTEELSLLPISVYNKTKMVSERIFLSYKDQLTIHCIRPATVCGFSPRMRLDLSVNMLTMQALQNKKITVFGGNQTRPNIHIRDMVAVYEHFLYKNDIPSGIYNAGFENISILEIAELISKKIPSEIIITESNDPRSYRLSSDKLLETGFEQSCSVEEAIEEMIEKFSSGEIKDLPESYTVNWMKKLNLHL